ncbi:MAG: SGNH/GDSL hydrolase family protein [Anaerolineales bacterium]|nr:MAG: SGNH/GDSL hydrolase family protein [Anaerolineales bacterium]
MPIIPTNIDTSLRNIYQRGIELGNDPHAFSLFGDCQARPAEFFGVFETDDELFASLSPELQETVDNFRGSFNRESPTAQDGTTPGALLWTQWHQGKFTCTFVETPVECELRIHRPSFVIIQIGTHFESRNTDYLRRIIEQLLDAGVVPILATKADNREKDERVNRDMAALASEYDLPLWNFWAAVSDLPNRGLYTRDDRPLQGDIYLTDEAAQIHRMTGLEVLNVVWRAVAGK